MRVNHHKQCEKLGNQLRKMIDKESAFKKPSSPKTIKRERLAKLGLKQAHEMVRQIADM
jgi:hypothetical protein